MARVVEDTYTVNHTLLAWVRLIGFGAIVGVAYWVVTLIIGRYVVEPWACRDLASAAVCLAPEVLAGKISTVLVATGAIFGMIRLRVVRPIIVAVASAVLLWELSAILSGLFWLETLAWSVLLYAISYALFGWIARAWSVLVAIIVAVVAAVVIRIAVMLY
jgi:hypothetical protein